MSCGFVLPKGFLLDYFLVILKKTAHHRCRNLAFKRKIYGLWSCVLQKPTKKKITEVIFRILKNKNLLTCKWSRKKKIKVLSNLHSVTYNLLSAKLTQNVQPWTVLLLYNSHLEIQVSKETSNLLQVT